MKLNEIIPKPKEQRVEVLIDVQNLYHSAKNLSHSRVNFSKVLEKAISGRKLIRAFGYVISTKTGEEKPFFEALLALGIETRIKELQEFYGGAKKGDWDVGLVIDAVRTAPGVDVVVLCSGDGDFVPLVDYLKAQGKRVEIIAFKKTTSSKLQEVADEFFDLGSDPKKYLMKIK